MKVNRIILLMIFMCVFACKKTKTEAPKVEFNFDFDKKSESIDISQNTYVIDLERLLRKEQNDELELYLGNLEKENSIKISVLTAPSKKNLDRKWEVTSSLINDGIIITFSKSMKTINIAFEKNTNKKIIKKIRDTIIKQTVLPNFIKENYYVGIKKGIIEIINNLEKPQDSI